MDFNTKEKAFIPISKTAKVSCLTAIIRKCTPEVGGTTCIMEEGNLGTSTKPRFNPSSTTITLENWLLAGLTMMVMNNENQSSKGEFQNGKMHGRGILTLTNGEKH
jgi:hypothetical protein